jgi:uncharacterized protein (TIGR02391 family)
MAPIEFHDLLPDAEAALALEPEELAGVVLQYLTSLLPDQRGQLNRYNFTLPNTVYAYPLQFREPLQRALTEAWIWLEREGMLAPEPGSQGESVFITRRGRQIATPDDLKRYRQSGILPRQLLHPRIAQKVWPSFLRGDYDTAVFQAFKEVEVGVRNACDFADAELGVPLMRKAFKPETGPLTDKSALLDEQEALAHLFAGAIGSYKNPHSHRNVQIEAREAVEMIMLASHLLNIVDRRQSG